MKKYKKRLYRCRECGHKEMIGTNHELDCYPYCKGKCYQIINPQSAAHGFRAKKQTAHEFIGEKE